MALFWKSFIECVLPFSVIAWYGTLSIMDKNHLNHIVKVAGQLLDVPQTSLATMLDQKVLHKARSILDSQNLTLHDESVTFPSGR